MSEEPTTPDLAELWRGIVQATNRHDLDAVMSFYAPDCVWEMETGTLEGVTATRAFLEEWFGSYEEFEMEVEELLDLGNGVVFAVIRQRGRPVGSSGQVQMRLASVTERREGLGVRATSYTESDIEKARAAAERLAESRG
jgi:ketosteroid isomerase-like protein